LLFIQVEEELVDGHHDPRAFHHPAGHNSGADRGLEESEGQEAEKVIKHKQAALAVIEAIRANPAITKAQAELLVDSVFPSNGAKYLSWYVNWWYKYGISDNDTFAAIRKRISDMSLEQYGISGSKMAKLVAQRAMDRIAKESNESMMVALEAEILLHPPKTEPDQITLDFWNLSGPETQILRSLEAHRERICLLLAEYED